MNLRIAALVWCALSTSACAHDAQRPAPPISVTIMTFNVENLFDTQHDEGKNDYTYLPLSAKKNAEHQARCAGIEVDRWREQCANWDWNDEVMESKMRALAATILTNNQGRGADVVVLQEVENLRVLEMLRTRHLGAAGYRPAVLLEGPDERGIDVAFLSRLPLARPPTLHAMQFTGVEDQREKDTRGILEATFELPDGELLTGFAVHFPAPYHPSDMRVQSYARLTRLLEALPAGRHAFAAGDFNTIHSEGHIIDRYVEDDWVVAHRKQCVACKGTHYYAPNDDWSFLDMILVTPNLTDAAGAWHLVPEATRVANAYSGQVTAQGTPRRFEAGGAQGVSDHWPLLVELRRESSRR